MKVWVQGIGLLGPGLASWATAQDILRGKLPLVSTPTSLPPPLRLPPAERRRAGATIKLALAVADEAVAQAQLDPADLATVFTSSSGEGVNCHALCETLATPAPMVSPTRFTNSVHNAAAGCWHIAVGSRAPSTSLCAFDGSFGAGLIEAAVGMAIGGLPMLLVSSESPYPEPLGSKRPLPDHFGLALVLTPAASARSIAALEIDLVGPEHRPSVCEDTALESLRRSVPSGAALPLMIALARGAGPVEVVLDYLGATRLRVAIS